MGCLVLLGKEGRKILKRSRFSVGLGTSKMLGGCIKASTLLSWQEHLVLISPSPDKYSTEKGVTDEQ